MYNIENFKNEISYDLTMDEAGKVILKYQDVIIRTVLEAKLNKTDNKELLELYGSIRSGRFIDGMEYLISMEDSKIDTDLAYVLMMAVDHQYVEDKLKDRVTELCYNLRLPIYTEKLENNVLAAVVTGLSFWNIQGFETTSEFRIDAMKKTISKVPQMLALAFNTDDENKVVKISNRMLLLMLKSVSPEITPSELAAAFLRSNIKAEDYKSEAGQLYVGKLRSLGIEICSFIPKEVLMDIVLKECKMRDHYNSTFEGEIKMTDSLLNPNFIAEVVMDAKENNSMDDSMERVNKLHKVFVECAATHKEFEYLF